MNAHAPASTAALSRRAIASFPLNAVLFAAAQDGIHYRFGDCVAAIEDNGNAVTVTFESGAREDFDLVVGADGLHSRTRALTFGEESDFVHHLGCYQAHFTTDNFLDLDYSGLLLNRPGRTVGCYSVHQNREIVVGLFFDSPPVTYDRADTVAQRQWVAQVFADMGWRTGELLEAMNGCDDFYFDPISQVMTGEPYRGRVALVGDAAYSPSLLSGMGTTLAIVGATVLADELISNPGDHQHAFRRYHARIADMITLSQDLARASRGWFIQPDNEQDAHSADEESTVLRSRAVHAASFAFRESPRIRAM